MCHDGRWGLNTYPTEDGIVPGFEDAKQWIKRIMAVSDWLADRLGG